MKPFGVESEKLAMDAARYAAEGRRKVKRLKAVDVGRSGRSLVSNFYATKTSSRLC